MAMLKESSYSSIHGSDSGSKRLGNRYQLLEKLGSGGMADVYRARDFSLGNKVVAVKILRSHLLRKAESLVRFQREAQAASRLNHPGIIKILDFGLSETGEPYLVMELFAGQSLNQMIENEGPLSLFEAIPVLTRLADAMALAHGRGVIHRDLKCSNIMIDRDRKGSLNAIIVDFGLAKMLEDEQFTRETLTQPGRIMGSLAYMAPEQCRGESVDVRADIYSFGCIVHEILTGQVLYPGRSLVDVLDLKNQTPPLLVLEPQFAGLASMFNRFVARLLEPDRDRRFASFLDVKQALLELESAMSYGGTLEISEPDCKRTDRLELRRSLPFLLATLVFVFFLLTLCWMNTGGNFRMHDADIERVLPLSGSTDPPVVQAFTSALIDESDVGEDIALFGMSKKTDQKLAQLAKKRPGVDSIMLGYSDVSNNGLLEIESLPIINLSLASTAISDEGMRSVSKLTRLRVLNVNGVKTISARGIAQLSRLGRLEKLYLNECDLDDDSLSAVAKIKSLKYLNLSSNPRISAIHSLETLKELRTVVLSGCRGITPGSVAGFQRVLPSCKVLANF